MAAEPLSKKAKTVNKPLIVEWRSSTSADWRCKLGARSFCLHRSVLGEGSRRSCFFAAAFNEQFKTDTTDLTELLPLACHDCFEAVLDFVYGHEIMFTLANAIKIHKIADVLQIVPLLTLAEVAIQQHAVPYTCSMLELAIELQVSVPAAKALLSRWRPSDLARCIFQNSPAILFLGISWSTAQSLCDQWKKV